MKRVVTIFMLLVSLSFATRADEPSNADKSSPAEKYYWFLLRDPILDPKIKLVLRQLNERPKVQANFQSVAVAPNQLLALAKLKAQISAGLISNEEQRTVKAALRGQAIVISPPDDPMKLFNELLRRFHIHEFYSRQGPRYERQVQESETDNIRSEKDFVERLDLKIRELSAKISLSDQSKIFGAFALGRTPAPELVTHLQDLSAALRKIQTQDRLPASEHLIAQRIVLGLAKATIAAREDPTANTPPLQTDKSRMIGVKEIHEGLRWLIDPARVARKDKARTPVTPEAKAAPKIANRPETLRERICSAIVSIFSRRRR